MTGYEIAAGTVQGRDHKDSGKSNQDGYYIHRDEERIIAIVCDGCSSGKRSEVGAVLVSRLLNVSILRHWDYINTDSSLKRIKGWRRVEEDVLAKIRGIALDLGGSLSEVVANYMLCTILGCVVTNERIIHFSLGDGVRFEGGIQKVLPSFPGNAPPYLAYRLFDTLPDGIKESQMHIRSVARRNVPEEFPICFGSDGLDYLIQAEQDNLPGLSSLVGPVSQFWEDDSFFQNPDKVRRKLFLLNKEVLSQREDGSTNRERGKLLDDTTLIVIRRVVPKEENDGLLN